MPDPIVALTAAIDATAGGSARRFASILGVDERTVRYWLRGERAVPEPVRRLCLLLVAQPALAGTLTALAEEDGTGQG